MAADPPTAGSDPARSRHRRRRWRRWAAAVLAVVLLWLGRPVWHVAATALTDRDTRSPPPDGMVDDASGFEAAAVREVWPVPADRREAERQLAALLARAQREGLPVSIAGARHSQGGHTIAPDGIQIDMTPFRWVEVDAAAKVVRAGAGARWADLLPALDAHGLSPAVMQSNHDFTLGGSISVNCHGWAAGAGPVASTVRSLRVMTADGRVHSCSPAREPELFRHVCGGYGLFGIILDAELDTVPNALLTAERALCRAADWPATRRRLTADGTAVFCFGRLCVAPDHLLEDAYCTVFRPVAGQSPPPLQPPGANRLKRWIFRSSVGSDYGKQLRWEAERRWGELPPDEPISRNQVLHEPLAWLANQDGRRTDILHEYFVPPERFAAWCDAARACLRAHPVDCLNVTVRHVQADTRTALPYAPGERLAMVMLFESARTPAADAAMAAFTQQLIAATLALGGRYYLPYRRHATPAQFHQAYPEAHAFFAAKRRWDPAGLFANRFATTYGG